MYMPSRTSLGMLAMARVVWSSPDLVWSALNPMTTGVSHSFQKQDMTADDGLTGIIDYPQQRATCLPPDDITSAHM
jgi:hypothetical protein